MLKKFLLCGCLGSLFLQADIEYGKGTFEMNGGFMGLTIPISEDIETYSLVNRHSNMFSDFYYGYNITWLDSQNMKQAQQSYNNLNGMFGQGNQKLPSMDYRLQGLDANLNLGYDLIHNSDKDFLGLGGVVGVSTPWIDSKKDSSDSTNNAVGVIATGFEKSKTKFLTYKVGISSIGSVGLNDYLSLYGSGTYAFQTAKITNDYASTDMSVNGTFNEFDIGIRFQPLNANLDLGLFSISPNLHGTLGYKIQNWSFDDVKINTSGQNMPFDMGTMEFDSKIIYAGFGYSFF
ncbi:MAG: hypothetical protein FNT15_07740 [Sulfurovum sp.]|nr:MAG: hypothetical protein FNT15_07740 [Sulfurovum sp.]